jgi:hypothetical protein
LYVAEPSDAARRIIIIGQRALRREESESQCKAEQAHQVESVSFHLRLPLS